MWVARIRMNFNGLQQIIGTQRVGNIMRPLGWKTLVDQLRFQYGERFDHNSEVKRPHIGNPCILRY